MTYRETRNGPALDAEERFHLRVLLLSVYVLTVLGAVYLSEGLEYWLRLTVSVCAGAMAASGLSLVWLRLMKVGL